MASKIKWKYVKFPECFLNKKMFLVEHRPPPPDGSTMVSFETFKKTKWLWTEEVRP